MPSSSWRLIHRDPVSPAPGASRPAPNPTAPAPRPGPESEATVLRGKSRAASHGAGSSARSVASQIPGLSSGVDQGALADEIRHIEKAAEERGYEAGRQRAEAELRAAVEGATALAERLEAVAPDRTSEIAHSIAELALAVARRIVGHEVRVEPSLLCSALEAAVSTINGSPEAHVLLNPAAVEPVTSAWEALHGRAYLGKKWLFEGDPTLPIGGCTLRYEHGFIEAGLEAQLEEIGIALDRAIPNLARGAIEEGVA
jgi:flagellar biosynthesis/type III secretory pathway protein FliH